MRTVNRGLMHTVFVLPYSLYAQGGSSKIFRSLLEGRQSHYSIVVFGESSSEKDAANETVIRCRPSLGRLDRSRLYWIGLLLFPFNLPGSAKKLDVLLNDLNPDHVHTIVQGRGYIQCLSWCARNSIPLSISVHDDIEHLTIGDPFGWFFRRKAAQAWRQACLRFVISSEIAEEYSSRYGKRPWLQITDGLEQFASAPRGPSDRRLCVYFAGALNVPYEPNFLALQRALKLFAGSHPDWEVRILLRGGRSIKGEDTSAPKFEVLPFASPAVVSDDLQNVDLLYLPLSLQDKYANFARFSLSTKLITYLGSGIPILYHGPSQGAAYNLLRSNTASLFWHSCNPSELITILENYPSNGLESVQGALAYANQRLAIGGIRQRFWSALEQSGNHVAI